MIHKLKVSHTIDNGSHRAVDVVPRPISEGDIIVVTNVDGAEDTYLVRDSGECLMKCMECSLFPKESCLRYDIWNGDSGDTYNGAYMCILRVIQTLTDDYRIQNHSLVFKDLEDVMEKL